MGINPNTSEWATCNLDELDFRLEIEKVSKLPKNRLDDIRHACKNNLRFLLNCVLRPPKPKKFPTMIERVHGPIIDGLLKPDATQDLEEWSDLDEYVVLASRGILKSTIGMALLTQVILCSPDVRILIISGKVEKAKSILAGARDPFLTNEVLRFLFPDFQIEEEHIKAEEFWHPRRDPALTYRDATITISSFDSVKAGGHYELILFDDATNEINSNNVENCEKTHGQYDDTDELVEPGGYRIFLGTKWLDGDLPDYILRKGAEEFEKSGNKTVTFCKQPAWTLRTDGTAKEVAARQLREKQSALEHEDVILTWPEKLTYRLLFKEYRKKRIKFYKQRLLDASIEQQHSFTSEIIKSQFVDRAVFKEISHHDKAVAVFWDLSSVYSGRRKKSETDYSAGIVAVFQKSTGKMFVVDALLDHFATGDDIANAAIFMYKNAVAFGPVIGFGMEDAAGSRIIESSILRFAKIQKVPVPPMNWIESKSTPNFKNVRIAQLASAMKNGFVYIVNEVPFVEEIKSEFEAWTVDAKRRKDDAIDCIAMIWDNYKDQVDMDVVSIMSPSEPYPSFEPELFVVDAPDPHADERENADIAWLSSFTVPHA